MKDIRGNLENWIYGLFGHEENTHITVLRLIETLIEENKSKIHSTLADYENGDFYEFNLIITKTPISQIKNKKSNSDKSFIGKLITDYDSIQKYESFWGEKYKALQKNGEIK